MAYSGPTQPFEGDTEQILLVKIAALTGATVNGDETPFRLWQKIAVALGCVVSGGENEHSLRYRIAVKWGAGATESDFDNVLLVKMASALSGTIFSRENQALLAQIAGLLQGTHPPSSAITLNPVTSLAGLDNGDDELVITWTDPDSVPNGLLLSVVRDGSEVVHVILPKGSSPQSVSGDGTYNITIINTGDGVLNLDSDYAILNEIFVGVMLPPQNLRATPLDSESDLSWDAVSGATSYKVYRDTVFLVSIVAPTVTYNDATVTNGVTYSYTVSATNAGGESAQSDPATVTPTGGVGAAHFLDDAFTDPDATGLLVHVGEVQATWVKSVFTHTQGTATIASNRMYVESSAGFGVWRTDAIAVNQDYSVNMVMRKLSGVGVFCGPAGRMDHTCLYFYYAAYDNNTASWYLYKTISGTFVQLGTQVAQALTAGQDYLVTLDMSDTTIRLLVDGVEVISATDSAIHSSNGFGPGVPGFLYYTSSSSSTGYHFDRMYATQSGNNPLPFDSNYALVVDGDSISGDTGRAGTLTFSQRLATLWNTDRVWNFAKQSQRVDEMSADYSTEVAPVYPLTAGYGKRLLCLLGGINDFNQGDTAATVLTRLQTYHGAAKSTGFATILIAPFKAGVVTGDNETERATLVASLVSDHSFADYFVNPNTDSRFQDPSDTTYFQSDTIHLTVAGMEALAGLVQAVVM